MKSSCLPLYSPLSNLVRLASNQVSRLGDVQMKISSLTRLLTALLLCAALLALVPAAAMGLTLLDRQTSQPGPRSSSTR